MPETNAIAALGAALADMRTRIAEAGDDIEALGTTAGTVADLVRRVLTAVADAVAWLGRAMADAAAWTRGMDAILALVEAASDLLAGIGASFTFGDLPEIDGVTPASLAAVTGALEVGRVALVEGRQLVASLPASLPQPQDFVRVRDEAIALLGERVDPEATGAGALGELLTAIGAGAS